MLCTNQFLIFSLQKRSNSKLSTQKVSGGSFNKRQTFTPFFPASKNHEVGNLHSRCQVQPTMEGVGFGAPSSSSSDGRGSSIADHGIECLDKVVINQEKGPPEVVPSTSMEVPASQGDPRAIHEILIKETVDIVPNIKWGDLEDLPFALSEGCGNSSKIAKIESVDSSDSVKQEYVNVADSGEPSHSPLQEGEVTSEDVELLPGPLFAGVHEESPDETWKEVSEIPSEDLRLPNVNPKDAVGTLKQTHDHRVTRMTKLEPDEGLCPNDANVKSCPSSPVKIVGKMTIQEPCDESEDGAVNLSEVSVINENAGMIKGMQDTNLLSHLNSSVEISVDDSFTETAEDPRGLQYDSTEGADLGEGEHGESKERFRERLWCFLFENLNRAVDELYLLCELECDMEQMNEAILVLEEAASDFKELKCRVEHFENTRRITSQSSKDGGAINVKTDHRRPHALSWEVRVLQSILLFFLFFSFLFFACADTICNTDSVRCSNSCIHNLECI